jgi:hypothetical protein
MNSGERGTGRQREPGGSVQCCEICSEAVCQCCIVSSTEYDHRETESTLYYIVSSWEDDYRETESTLLTLFDVLHALVLREPCSNVVNERAKIAH